MRVKWEVSDGYVGGSRPHYIEIDDDELSDCRNEDERNDLINNYVQEDFNTEVTFDWEIV